MEQISFWLYTLGQSLDWDALGRLTLAAVMGGIVGAEREISGHPAGLRTNILISVSACLFTILSIRAFPLKGAAQDTPHQAACQEMQHQVENVIARDPISPQRRVEG